MCGYAGYVAGPKKAAVDETVLTAMGHAIRARGPDDQGTWLYPAVNLGFVHQRLAIQDLSPLGAQPMASASERYAIAFNGEIYNFLHLRNELKQLGYSFKGGSDTEVMLAAFEAWGVEQTLPKLVGMFSFALIDTTEHQLWLVRDRLGEKPLYYYHHDDSLIFGSELKALMACPDFQKAINPDAVALLLKHNYIPAPHCIFLNTFKLEPAHWLRFDLNNVQQSPIKQCYWKPDLDWDSQLTQESLHQTLESLLDQVIADQMISDAPLGAFLSGGVDSSTIVALMQKQSRQPVRTFSVGFNVPGYNEAEHAKAVAQHLGTSHTEFYVEAKDALAVIPKLPEIYDEPFADSSQIPTFIVSQLARQHVTVALSGDGGDELFAGYSRYPQYDQTFNHRRTGLAKQLLSRLPSPAMAFMTKYAKANQRPLPLALIEEKVMRYKKAFNSDNARDFYREQVSFWQDPCAVVKGAKPIPYSLDRVQIRQDNISTFQWCDINSYLPDDILTKVDRAAMANSLETRVPLLDHRVVELSLRVPTTLNMRDGLAKTPLRKILYQYVPKHLIEREKQGFAIPKAEWLRNELREWADGLLSEEALAKSNCFYPSLIRQKWSAHLNTEHDYSFHLWPILMFQSWYEEYVD